MIALLEVTKICSCKVVFPADLGSAGRHFRNVRLNGNTDSSIVLPWKKRLIVHEGFLRYVVKSIGSIQFSKFAFNCTASMINNCFESGLGSSYE
jgi:hypothetical protein